MHGQESPCPRPDELGRAARVEVARLELDVAEDRRSSGGEHGLGRRQVRERREDDLVAVDAGRDERDVQRGAAAGHRDCVRGARDLADSGFEAAP